MTQPQPDQQPQLPSEYVLPADLVGRIYGILSQVPAGGGVARTVVRLEDEIGRQNQAYQQQEGGRRGATGTSAAAKE